MIDKESRPIVDRIADRVPGLVACTQRPLVQAGDKLKRTETLEGDRLRRLPARGSEEVDG